MIMNFVRYNNIRVALLYNFNVMIVLYDIVICINNNYDEYSRIIINHV